MSAGRAAAVLDRFPAHLGLRNGAPHRLLGHLVRGLGAPLDGLASDLGRVRRAHRLGEAPTEVDLLRLAALHGLEAVELAVLGGRVARSRELLATLDEALASGGDAAGAATDLLDSWSLALARPRLDAFGGEADGPPRVAAAFREALAHPRFLDALRSRVRALVAIHARGNGTVQALLEGAGNALDLDVGEVEHGPERFWHAAPARDRLRLLDPAGDAIRPADEVLGCEENPPRRLSTGSVPRRHRELFDVVRRGFGRVRLRVRLTGRGTRTVGPMVVNRDEGRGLAFARAVPEGQVLELSEDGRATLDGTDVTPLAWAWEGACFGGSDASPSHDFVFVESADAPPDRAARFARSVPPDALDPAGDLPHDGRDVPTPGVGIGRTRFAFFVTVAHASSRPPGSGEPHLLAPRHVTGRFGGSVFGAASSPVPVKPGPAADVELSWLEREAYAVRIFIPSRFRGMEDAGIPVRERVLRALDRHRPAGVRLEIAYVEDRWILGDGTLPAAGTGSLVDRLRGGTVLWAEPSPDA